MSTWPRRSSGTCRDRPEAGVGAAGAGEGSIYPYRTKFAAYVWVTTPDGKRERKYVYGQTREETMAEC